MEANTNIDICELCYINTLCKQSIWMQITWICFFNYDPDNILKGTFWWTSYVMVTLSKLPYTCFGIFVLQFLGSLTDKLAELNYTQES